MKCHSCGSKMRVENYEGIQIEVCPICQGIWLDSGELKHIVEKREQEFDQTQIDQVNLKCDAAIIPGDESEREVICPKCGSRMNPVNYSYCSGIVINKCPNSDGLWLDQGEIEKAQIFSQMWEDELRENGDKYVGLLKKLNEEETKKNNKELEAISPNRFKFMSCLFRGIVKLDQTV